MEGDLLDTEGNVIEVLHHHAAACVYRTSGVGNGREEFIELCPETYIIEANSEL
jgi:hypothetical protein